MPGDRLGRDDPRVAEIGGLVAAIDIGGTTIKGEVLAPDGSSLAALARPTPVGQGGGPVIDVVTHVVRDLAARSTQPLHAIGVAVPGLVDVRRGVALSSANLGWSDVPVREALQARFDVPVRIEHDVAAAGLAELRLGAGQDVDDLLVVVIGTGMSAVVVLGGRHIRGRAGQAGELGHVVVRPDGPQCRCGRRGCLEAVASAGAIARRYTLLSGSPVTGAADVAARLGRDRWADAVWQEAVEALADGLLDAVALLAPERIVIGGGLSAAGELLLRPLREQMRRRATVSAVPEIVPAAFGARAGVVGAALVARDPDPWLARP